MQAARDGSADCNQGLSVAHTDVDLCLSIAELAQLCMGRSTAKTLAYAVDEGRVRGAGEDLCLAHGGHIKAGVSTLRDRLKIWRSGSQIKQICLGRQLGTRLPQLEPRTLRIPSSTDLPKNCMDLTCMCFRQFFVRREEIVRPRQ